MDYNPRKFNPYMTILKGIVFDYTKNRTVIKNCLITLISLNLLFRFRQFTKPSPKKDQAIKYDKAEVKAVNKRKYGVNITLYNFKK
jgi:hypothetical protein